MSILSELSTGGWLVAAVNKDRSKRRDPLSLLGKQVGKYLIREMLSEGGSSCIYRAERVDSEFTQEVAVKVLKAYKRNLNNGELFEYEKNTLAKLTHPNISFIVDSGSTFDGSPYIVMEYVDGLPLDVFIKENGCTTSDRLELFRQILDAVHFAHGKLIAHGDIKPANIMVRSDKKIVLVDFGIARFIHSEKKVSGGNLFTPTFASPEQKEGKAPTVSTDIYQLGLILRGLFFDDSVWRHRVLSPLTSQRGRLNHIDFSALLFGSEFKRWESSISRIRCLLMQQIAAKCIRLEPENRYQSVSEIKTDIDNVFAKKVPVFIDTTWALRLIVFFLRNRASVLSFAMLFFFSVCFGYLYYSALRDKNHQLTEMVKINAQVNDFFLDVYESADPRLNRGQPLTIDALLDLSANRVENLFLNDQVTRNQLIKAISSSYVSLGRYTDAAIFLDRASVHSTALFSLEQRSLAGYAYFRASQADTAIKILNDVYSRVGVSSKRELLIRAQTAAYISRIFQSRNDEASAMSFANESMQLLERATVDKSTMDDQEKKDVGMIFNIIGLVYKGYHLYPGHSNDLDLKWRMEKARYAFYRSFSYFVSASGDDGRYEPLQQLPLSNVITVEYLLGNAERAFRIAKQVRLDAERWVPDSPYSWLQAYLHLPAILALQGRAEDSVVEYKKIYSIYRDKGYEDSASLVSLIANIGISYYHLGDCRQARGWLDRANIMSKKFYSSDHPIVINIIESIRDCE